MSKKERTSCRQQIEFSLERDFDNGFLTKAEFKQLIDVLWGWEDLDKEYISCEDEGDK